MRPRDLAGPRCRYAALALVSAALLLGCGTDPEVPEPDVPEETHATPTAAVDPPDEPPTGRCYRVGFTEALALAAPDRPDRKCGRRHTAETYRVGRLDLVVDGHQVAVDAPRVQDQVAAACPAALPDFLGVGMAEVRLSMVQPVWYTPTLEQAHEGAEWFRCDAVVVARDRQLLEFRGSLADALAGEDADRFAMCGTAAPDAEGFERVVCSREHSWRAVAVVDFEARKYPGARAARERGQTPCEDIGADHAADPLDYRWGYEWPTKKQWRNGMTYGRCWVPD